MREIKITGGILCRACAQGGYYRLSSGKDVFFDSSAMQNSHNELEIRSKLWIEMEGEPVFGRGRHRTIPVSQAVGTVLAHDITEIRKGEFKGSAFRKGHTIKEEDLCHLQRLGKEHLYILDIADDEMHEDDAAYEIASALKGEGVEIQDKPKEGRINLVAGRDGLLKINSAALLEFNMLGEIMCSTLHNNTMVKKGQIIAGTRAIPLVVNKYLISKAIAIGQRARNSISNESCSGVIEVKKLRKFRAGIVITGNEVFYGKIKDAFAPVIENKLRHFDGEIVGIKYAPDDEGFIEQRLSEILEAGADLLITTGGLSVDPDDVTRFAVKNLSAEEIIYGSAVLPGAMFLLAYIKNPRANTPGSSTDTGQEQLIPLIGLPACGMYHKITVFDIILPRILAGEIIGKKELAELGHGGLCLNCKECRYPICPFGK